MSYSQEVYKFAKYPRERAKDYVVLGLVDEIGELFEKVMQQSATISELLAEAGDIVWYINSISIEYGLMSLEDLYKLSQNGKSFLPVNDYDMLSRMTVLAAKIAGKRKKEIRDGTIKSFEDELIILIRLVECYCAKIGYSFTDCCQYNFEKLSSRNQRGVIQGSGDNR